tara:strand:+ start:1570 stop:2337 length:768 start_codon:yes stop_codon:yes gene_type:complete
MRWVAFPALWVVASLPIFSSETVLPPDELRGHLTEFKLREETLNRRIEENPENLSALSARGDARMFLGNFEGAREDYAKMIELDPTLEVSHWRIGIAYFYLGEFVKAERQFEIYHRYDAVDRENGIWRFMSQTSAQGEEKARKDLLPYEQTDRPPYPWLYEMFQGKIEPDEIFQRIEEAGFPRGYEERVRFHADLYVGIYLELVKGDKKAALQHLRNAVANQYGRATGTYMWQVARLHHARLGKSFESAPLNPSR